MDMGIIAHPEWKNTPNPKRFREDSGLLARWKVGGHGLPKGGQRFSLSPGERYAFSAIGSGAEDCASAPSHTTVRAVFRIRRLNAAAWLHGGRKV